MNEKLRIALLKVLNLRSLRFYGLMVYNFQIIDGSDLPFVGTMAVGFVNGRWTIYYSNKFCNEKLPEELIYVLLHEIIHALSGHTIRGIGKEEVAWALAIDHVTNVAIDADIDSSNLNGVKKPSDRTIIDKLLKWKPPLTTAEEVYQWLLKNAKIEYEVPWIKVTIDDTEYTFSMDLIMGTSTSEEQQGIKGLQAQARVHAKDRGLISGNIKELLKELLEVEVPADVILEKSIKNLLETSDERSWKMPHKRFMAHNLLLPGLAWDSTLGDVICLLDHSGSISTKDAALFSSVIRNCSPLFQNFHIVKHDHKVKETIVLTREELMSSSCLFEILGRGGTSHKEAFQYVEDIHNDDGQISLVLMLTDWESDIENIWKTFSWVDEVPVLSVVPKGSNIPPGYGDILPIIDKRRSR